MGLAFAAVLLRAPARTRAPDLARIRSLASIGAVLFVRSASLYACFTLATAVAARIGAPSLGAHQIAFQLFNTLALVLDAIAIAGQVIVGRALGAGDVDGAFAAARRMLEWAAVAGLLIAGALLALTNVLPRVFTPDPAVIDRAHAMWPLFCLLMPAAAVVFALDGVLIGAGDARFLAGAMLLALVVFAPIVLAADTIGAVWVALDVLMAVRLATLGPRFARGRWALAGATT
jgi:Na+-driven multidrug efflux pump